MGRIDPNLRDVLDSLSVKEGVRHPTQDLDTLRTIVDRLNPGGGPSQDDILAPDAGAPAPEEELQEQEAEPETEADLGPVPEDEGGLSFDAEPLPEPEQEVRFERVDPTAPAGGALDPYADTPDETWADDLDDDDLMEFESVPAGRGLAEEPDWSDPALEDGDWDTGTTEPGWGAPEDEELAAATELGAALAEAEGREETPQARPGAFDEEAAVPTLDLDPETADDLAELERQLAELEHDLEALGSAHGKDKGPFDRARDEETA